MPLPSGGHVNPFAVIPALDLVCGVEASQVVQLALDRVEVRFVRGRGASDDPSGRLVAAIRGLFPPDVTVEARAVSEILAGPSGKQHRVVAFRA